MSKKILIIFAVIIIIIISVIIYKTKKSAPDNSIPYNKDSDLKYAGAYSGTYTYKQFGQKIATININFTYKNKDNILLNEVSFDECKVFPDGKDILTDCPDKTVRLDESTQTIVGSCIDAVTRDGYVKNVKIHSLKLNFSEDTIESVNISGSATVSFIKKNETFKIPVTRI